MERNALIGLIGADVELMGLPVPHDQNTAGGQGIIMTLHGVVALTVQKAVDLVEAVGVKRKKGFGRGFSQSVVQVKVGIPVFHKLPP
jgi:hypothetical protein